MAKLFNTGLVCIMTYRGEKFPNTMQAFSHTNVMASCALVDCLAGPPISLVGSHHTRILVHHFLSGFREMILSDTFVRYCCKQRLRCAVFNMYPY